MEKNYFTELQRTTQSRGSTVTTIIGQDSERIDALCEYQHKYNPYLMNDVLIENANRVIRFTATKGLQELVSVDDKGVAEWKTYSPQRSNNDEDGFDGLFGNSGMNTFPHSLTASLQTIDTALREQPTTLIINTQTVPLTPEAQNTLADWSQDDSLFGLGEPNRRCRACGKRQLAKTDDDSCQCEEPKWETKGFGSHIFLFVSAKSVVPDEISGLLNFYNPTPSYEDERYEQIVSFGYTLEIFKDEDDVKENKETIDEIVRTTQGLSLSQTQTAILESIVIHKAEHGYADFHLKSIKDFKVKELGKSENLKVWQSKDDFSHVGGYFAIKELLRERVVRVLNEPEEANYWGQRIPKGLILFGSAGTGKSLFAEALAGETGRLIVELNMNRIKEGVVGASEKNILNALKIIDDVGSNIIVYMDEIDRMGERKDTNNTDSGVTSNLFSELLSWMGNEDRECFVVGTTNKPEVLDFAFKRTGRFDYILPVLYPDFEARVEIWKIWTTVKGWKGNLPPLADDVKFTNLAKESEWFSGSDIVAVVQNAIAVARKRYESNPDSEEKKVTANDFIEAIDNFMIPVDKRKEQTAQYIELAKEFTNDKSLFETLTDYEVEISDSSKEGEGNSRTKGISDYYKP